VRRGATIVTSPPAPMLDADARGRRVAFVAHCLLNQNVRYLGGATRPAAVREVVERYLDAGVGISQMPCPEQLAWGGVLKPRMLRLYGSRALRSAFARRVFVTIVRWWSRDRYRRLAHRVASDIADYAGSEFEVVEVVGVGASPSCGVWTTLDLDRAVRAMADLDPTRLDVDVVNRDVVAANAVEGSGLFVTALRRELARRRVAVRFAEHDLIGELRDADAVAPTGQRADQRPSTPSIEAR
jgi:predicted secreted protein